MNAQPRPPIRHRPPRRGATSGDTLFALGVAGLGLLVAAGLLAAGGAPWLERALSGTGASPAPPGLASARPIAPPSSTAIAGPSQTPGPTAPTPGPTAPSSPTPGPAASSSPEPSPSPPAASVATPKPTATPGPFTMNLYRKGVFVHQVNKEACVAAAAQNMLNVIRRVEDGTRPDVSKRTQLALYNRIVRLTTWADSHNGGTGPGGWAALLTERGYPYAVRVYATRNQAITAAAAALRRTGRPVGILAWAGVHSWVMTGFTATADPAKAKTFAVRTAYVIDPWYPWVSTRWPRSEAPNAPRDAADLKANVLPWKLASGPYPGRDGRYLLVLPLGS